MKDIVVMTMQSVRKSLNQRNRELCFELFGYDFIIDEMFRTWLIEVNTNPCLEESSALLKMLLPRMVDDALKLTVDQVFPRKSKDWVGNEQSNYSVKGYSNNENMWEYLIQIGIVKTSPNNKVFTTMCKNILSPH